MHRLRFQEFARHLDGLNRHKLDLDKVQLLDLLQCRQDSGQQEEEHLQQLEPHKQEFAHKLAGQSLQVKVAAKTFWFSSSQFSNCLLYIQHNLELSPLEPFNRLVVPSAMDRHLLPLLLSLVLRFRLRLLHHTNLLDTWETRFQASNKIKQDNRQDSKNRCLHPLWPLLIQMIRNRCWESVSSPWFR